MEGSRRIGGSPGAVKVARPAAGGGKLASALGALQELPITTKCLPSVDEILTLGWYTYDAETIIGNMDTRLFLGGAEKTTLKDLSESLGKETIYLLNNSVSKGNSPSYSQSQQKLGKDVLSCKGVESTTPKYRAVPPFAAHLDGKPSWLCNAIL